MCRKIARINLQVVINFKRLSMNYLPLNQTLFGPAHWLIKKGEPESLDRLLPAGLN